MNSDIRTLMARHNIRPDKSFGQNFLSDEDILSSIADDSAVGSEDTVLEIGPGLGTLTRVLAARARRVVAVELDRRLMPALYETLKDYNNVELINADFMGMTIDELTQKLGAGFRVAANLPYYITTPIIMKILESSLEYASVTVLVQKEVALRMAAAPATPDYGALSLAVQYRTRPQLLTKIAASAFTPAPQVESRVVRLDKLAAPPVTVLDEKTFFSVVRSAFSMRRKTMANNLISSFGLSRETAENTLATCNIPPLARGEQLSMLQLGNIADFIFRLSK